MSAPLFEVWWCQKALLRRHEPLAVGEGLDDANTARKLSYARDGVAGKRSGIQTGSGRAAKKFQGRNVFIHVTPVEQHFGRLRVKPAKHDSKREILD